MALAVLFAILAGLVVVAAWARWGGPDPEQAEWRLDLGDEAVGPPTVDGGAAYVATASGTVVAVDVREGRARWRFDTGERAAGEPLAEGGLVHVATSSSGEEGGHVFTVDARTGEERWRSTTTGPLHGPPAVDGGSVFVAADDVIALDAVTGEERWRRTLDAGEGAVAAGRGLVLVVTAEGITALDAASGVTRWDWATASRPEVPPEVADELALTGDGRGSIVALDLADGDEVWSVATGGLLRQTPVAGGAAVVAATVDGVVGLGPATGEQEWRVGPAADQRLRLGADGERVAVAADDLRVLDARTGGALFTADLGPSRQPPRPTVAAGQVLVATGSILQLWVVP
jgi:outer membrane protein assembly factor BamB